jgi:hypothetical protein
MLANFIFHPVLLVGWHIYFKERLLPFDLCAGRDISSALIFSVFVIIAPYKLWPIFFSSARLPSSALFHSSRCEAVFGCGFNFRESTGIMSNLSINVIIRRCFDILIHWFFYSFHHFPVEDSEARLFCAMVGRLKFLNHIQHLSNFLFTL